MKEELKAKRLIDVEKGIEYRKRCVDLVNHVLEGKARLKRVHTIIKPFSGHKENTLLNRLTPTDSEDAKGMGLDHLLEAPGATPRFIAIRRFIDSDLYYKMPQGVSEKGFVEVILPQIYFLLFTPKLTKYALVNGGDFGWVRAKSQSNERRLSAIFKDGFYRGRKVNPERDLHWISVDGNPAQAAFLFEDTPNLPLSKALLRIIGRE